MAVLMAHGEAEAEIVADDPAQLADIEKAAAEHRAAGRINHARFNEFIAAKAAPSIANEPTAERHPPRGRTHPRIGRRT